ncbi:MAG: ice-binding family protein [Microthrixaceae bacterium]
MSITFVGAVRSNTSRGRRNSLRLIPFVVALVSVVGLLGVTPAGAAESPVGLGTATSFAILAGAGITNTGATTITGDVGSFATTSQTGFGTVVQTGVNHAGDAVTQQGKLDLVDAFNDAAGRGPATAPVPVDLVGKTLTPGVYNSGTIELSGTLTLDAQGDPDAVFVFQAASTLVTASASSVVVINGGPTSACNVYWKVGSSATLGSGSSFVGTILAADSISLNSTAQVEGRLLAQTGAVTLIDNTITNAGCATLPTKKPAPLDTTTPGDVDGTPVATVPGAGTTPNAGDAPPSDIPPSDIPPSRTPPTPDLTTSLAFTGSDWRIVALGTSTLLVGLFCVALSRSRRGANG